MSTNIELEKICKSLGINNFIGVFMMNEINKVSHQSNECFIVNLQNSDQSGSHWTAVYKNNNNVYYFDSYGAPVPNEIRKRYNKFKINNFQSDDNILPDKPLQSYSQTICGHLCVLFLLLCSKGKSFESIINLLQNNISKITI
jgi:hypothetical protein